MHGVIFQARSFSSLPRPQPCNPFVRSHECKLVRSSSNIMRLPTTCKDVASLLTLTNGESERHFSIAVNACAFKAVCMPHDARKSRSVRVVILPAKFVPCLYVCPSVYDGTSWRHDLLHTLALSLVPSRRRRFEVS